MQPDRLFIRRLGLRLLESWFVHVSSVATVGASPSSWPRRTGAFPVHRETPLRLKTSRKKISLETSLREITLWKDSVEIRSPFPLDWHFSEALPGRICRKTPIGVPKMEDFVKNLDRPSRWTVRVLSSQF